MTLSALIIALLVLPGCGVLDWIKSTFGGQETQRTMPSGTQEGVPVEVGFGQLEILDDGSAAVVSIEGKTVVSEKSLNKAFQQLMQEDPRIAQMLPLMGGEDALKDRVAQALAEQKLMKRWAVDENLAQNAEFAADRERMLEQIDYLLADKYFKMNYKASVPASEVKKFYEDNKDKMAELMISRGGIRAEGIKFDNEADAQAFAAKVKAAGMDLAKAAEAADKTDAIQDFRVVNGQSVGIAPSLREKIMALKTFPSVNVIKVDDKNVWVVKAESKEDTVYRPFEEIKDQLKAYLESQKQEEVVSDAKNKLKEKYSLKIEKTFAQPLEEAQVKMRQDTSAVAEVNEEHPAADVSTEQITQAA